MTRRNLIDEVLRVHPRYSRRDAEVIVHAVFNSMSEALRRNDRIEVRGFGSFIVKQRRAREGRNPKSGRPVAVAAKRVPFFKVGKDLRLRIDGQAVPVGQAEPLSVVSAEATVPGSSLQPAAAGRLA